MSEPKPNEMKEIAGRLLLSAKFRRGKEGTVDQLTSDITAAAALLYLFADAMEDD